MRSRLRSGVLLGALALVVALVGAAVSCSSPGGLPAGASCHGSSECAVGLVCDFGQTPAVCAESGTFEPTFDAGPQTADAAPGTPDAAVDDDATP